MKPNAFVLMPFGGEFDNIYTHFISPALSEAGYNVTRADTLTNQQSILKDIIETIYRCDLIVADLSDSNPNVYYELGVAHTLSKNVILLCQNIDITPFDIKQYRIIKYSTHFSDIIQTKNKLRDLATNTLKGKTSFGNPVTDFLNANVGPILGKNHTNTPADDEDDLGFFDYAEIVEKTFPEMTNIILEIKNETDTFASSFLTILQANNSTSFQKALDGKAVMKQYAATLDNYAKRIETQNKRYSAITTKFGSSLENMLRVTTHQTLENQKGRHDFIATLPAGIAAIDSFSDQIQSMLESFNSAPNLEKTFNRAKNNACTAIKNLYESIQETKRIFARIQDTY